MNISDAVILAVLTILSGAVTKLWADNRKLSAQVAKLSEIFGIWSPQGSTTGTSTPSRELTRLDSWGTGPV